MVESGGGECRGRASGAVKREKEAEEEGGGKGRSSPLEWRSSSGVVGWGGRKGEGGETAAAAAMGAPVVFNVGRGKEETVGGGPRMLGMGWGWSPGIEVGAVHFSPPPSVGPLASRDMHDTFFLFFLFPYWWDG